MKKCLAEIILGSRESNGKGLCKGTVAPWGRPTTPGPHWSVLGCLCSGPHSPFRAEVCVASKPSLGTRTFAEAGSPWTQISFPTYPTTWTCTPLLSRPPLSSLALPLPLLPPRSSLAGRSPAGAPGGKWNPAPEAWLKFLNELWLLQKT